MKYKDIFEFQEKKETKEKIVEAFKEMNEDDVKALIETCGTIQGKIYYSKLFNERKNTKQ